MKPLVAIVCAMFVAFAFGAEKKAAPKKIARGTVPIGEKWCNVAVNAVL